MFCRASRDDRFMLQPDFLRGIAALEEFGLTYRRRRLHYGIALE